MKETMRAGGERTARGEPQTMKQKIGTATYEISLCFSKNGHNFSCADPDDMNYEVLAKKARHFKQDEKGVAIMCKIMEDMRRESLKEGIKEGAINTAKKMLEDGTISIDKIAEFVVLSIDDVKKLEAGQAL